jgi:PIN domain nuclease of toxin-antitoxin system
VASVVADTHALLWILRGTLRERSPVGADDIDQALMARRSTSRSAPSSTCATWLTQVASRMGEIPREKVPDPFDRIIAATALTLDLPLVSADEDIRKAIGERVIW